MALLEITDKVLKGWDQLVKNVELVKKNPVVKVGVLEGAGLHHEVARINGKKTSGGVVEGKTVALVATWNEFGTQASGKHPGIPKRPAIRNTIENNTEELVKQMGAALGRIAAGESDPVTELEHIGLWTSGAVKKTISSGVPPANAPRTIAAKRSSKPLIDSGQYRQSITHEVVASDNGGEGEVVTSG